MLWLNIKFKEPYLWKRFNHNVDGWRLWLIFEVQV